MTTGKTAETQLKDGVLNNDEWVHRWAVGNTGFHQPKPDSFLEEIKNNILAGDKKSLFLPLCGKSLDIIWMYEEGHTVAGVEIAEQAIKELFEENKIEYEVQPIPGVGKLYKSKDGRILLYVADLFDLSVEQCGTFDVIWDSKSFVAINVADQEKYRDLLLSLMEKTGVYLMATLEYDPSVWPGPPHSITDKRLRELYGQRCSIELMVEQNMVVPPATSIEAKTAPASPDYFNVDSEIAAIRASPYVYGRWHKMTFQ